MSSVPAGGQHSMSSPRAKRISTPKQKPERDERDTEIDRLEMDNQFLKDLLQKAKTERESLIAKLSSTEQQAKLQDALVLEAQQLRDAERAAFRRNVENSRTVLDSKYTKIQNTMKERDALLLLWTEYATATLIETPESPIRPLLVKTCSALPAAKELAGKIYENFVDTVKTISRPADDAEAEASGGDGPASSSDSQRAPNPNPKAKSAASRPGASGYDMLMGVAPEEPASDSAPSRGMTAALRDINREVEGASQKIDALLVDSENDPATDANADNTGATGAILGQGQQSQSHRQFLSDGPASSDEDSSTRRVRTAVGEGHGGSPKKPKKKAKKKKTTKEGAGGSVGASVGAGKGVGSGKLKKPARQEYDMHSLDQNSSVLSNGDQNPANFWWQGNMGSSQGTRSMSPSKQRDGANAANDKSISFSDAEINRLLQELRQQQQPQADKTPARGNQGKHSMNLGTDDVDEEEEEEE